MRLSYTGLVLATLAIGQTFAASIKHGHFHTKRGVQLETKSVQVEAPVERRDLIATDSTKLLSMGALVGVNAVADNGGVWLGTGGAYTNTFINDSGESLILVIWGPLGSWVNAVQPLVTASIAPNASCIVSFASGSIGAWSALYPDTQMLNGQVSNTWGEYTFSPVGVVDVSREPNMSGRPMSIVGPTCTSDMERCVFVCSSGNICMTDYELLNCAAGSQPGAQYGTYFGAPSGGCGGLGASASLTTTFL